MGSLIFKVKMRPSIFLLFFFISSSISVQEEKVSIQVYYETLCPDSIAFITQQLFPTYIKLGKYLNVEFKPYGFATSTPNDNGGFTFSCQHGPNECNGNLYAACLIDRLHGQNEIQVAVINCIMDDLVPHEATQNCMEKLMITEPSYQEIDQCHSSNEGQNLLYSYGLETDNLEPAVYFIPWITFENEWNEMEFNGALENLEEFLCSDKLSNVPECA